MLSFPILTVITLALSLSCSSSLNIRSKYNPPDSGSKKTGVSDANTSEDGLESRTPDSEAQEKNPENSDEKEDRGANAAGDETGDQGIGIPGDFNGHPCIGHRCKNIVLSADEAAALSYTTVQSGNSIQDAVNNASAGDVLIVEPGSYSESVSIDKPLTLASTFYLEGDPDLIDQTTIFGTDLGVITIESSVQAEAVKIIGFKIFNENDKGIIGFGSFEVYNCHISGKSDGLSFEDTSGIARWNTMTENSDDGIDIDGDSAAIVEFNNIFANGQDGIEHRLQPYDGDLLRSIIRYNIMQDNDEDGYQIIDYNGYHPKEIILERNLITDNGYAGVGFMPDASTNAADYTEAHNEETVYLINNTIAGNKNGLRGGGNIYIFNNIFHANLEYGIYDTGNIKDITKGANNLFFGNAAGEHSNNIDGIVLEDSANTYKDPQLGADYVPQNQLYVLDLGIKKVGDYALETKTYSGSGPDIGFIELVTE